MRFLKPENNIKAEDIKKVLLVKLSHLGDVIMCTAVLESIREIFPSARITLLVKEAYVPLLEGNIYVNRIVGFDAPWNTRKKNWLNIHKLLGIFAALKKDRYNLVIDLEDDKKSNIFLYLL